MSDFTKVILIDILIFGSLCIFVWKTHNNWNGYFLNNFDDLMKYNEKNKSKIVEKYNVGISK